MCAWRPAVINQRWLDAAKKAIEDDSNILCLTDQELLDEINDNLEPCHRLKKDTFEEYKKGVKLKDRQKQAMLDEFSLLYRKALRKMKKQLVTFMVTDPDKRQRYAWIIERKFKEWNIRGIWNDKDKDNDNGKELPSVHIYLPENNRNAWLKQ